MCRTECPWKKFLIHEIQCNAGWDLMCAWDVVNSSKPYLGHMHTAPYVPRPIAFILCKTTGKHVCFWSMLPFHTYQFLGLHGCWSLHWCWTSIYCSLCTSHYVQWCMLKGGLAIKLANLFLLRRPFFSKYTPHVKFGWLKLARTHLCWVCHLLTKSLS